MSRDLSSLLRIDFEAAVAKLAWAQLQGAWEIPAELARLAIAAGADAVAVGITSSRLTLRARGVRLEPRSVANFAAMLDRELEAEERHRAMIELEAAEALVLAAIACSPVKAVALRIGGDRGTKLEMRDGGELRVIHPGIAADDAADLKLEIDGLSIDADKARRWLRRAGRFAPVALAVDGRRVDLAFDDPLISWRIEVVSGRRQVAGGDPRAPRLSAAIALPRRGSAPRLWLLRHGIIATRATVPGHPSFEAAIEMAPVTAGAEDRDGARPSPADLRQRLGPYLPSLLDAAARMMIRLGSDASALPGATRARVARLLLEALRRRLRVAEISGVRIFTLVHPGGRELASIDDIARRVRVERGGACALDAIAPDQDPGGFALPERGVLVLDESERTLLGEHLCVVFDTPPARLRPSPGRRLVYRLADALPMLRRRRGDPVVESELSPGERRFLSRLRAALASAADGDPPAVAFHRGDGAAFETRDGIALPRSSAVLRRCVEAVERDPAWLYPAMVSLIGGPRFQDLRLERSDARRRWLAGR